MAGAGYKLFNTGDVLTAAQVNTYLMEQTVMVFANAAARTTALSGVVSEGMISYLKDTNAVEVYDGSNWVSSDDPNAIQNTIVDAKGDLITATASDVPARLAVGNNGETLVADSSASTGLRWQGNFAAGKNIVINGDFRINQRSFTSTTSNGVYGHDRWSLQTNSTCTYSTQTFTPGTAPVAGYEGVNFARMATTTNSSASEYAIFQYKAEDVRTLAGQTATVSFWAKAASGTPKLGVELGQLFGSGGSSAVNGTGQAVTLSTSWTRYSVTISVPSISGKTIGTGSYVEFNFWCSAGSSFNGRSGTVGNQSATIDIWGVQLEAGNVATAFQTATGTLAGELAACERYFYRTKFNKHFTPIRDTNIFFFQFKNPTTMRTSPSVSTNLTTKVANDTGLTAVQVALYYGSFIAGGPSTITLGTDSATVDEVSVFFTGATLTQGQFPTAAMNGGYFDVSAEL